MNYSIALNSVKRGAKARRAGWNGKGMFIFLEPGSAPAGTLTPFIDGLATINGVDSDLFVTSDKDTTVRMPTLCMRAADGSNVIGWLASQTDQLAEDWEII